MGSEEDLASSASDDDGEQLSDRDRDSGSDSGNGYDSDSDEGNNSGSGSEDEVDEDKEDAAAREAQRVRADMDEMRRMMADMDKVKMRLQFRFAAERQVTLERREREEQAREEQVAARRQAEEEARSRRVETSLQTDSDISQKQMESAVEASQQNRCPPNPVAEAALPAQGTGIADEPPQKAKPAGLSLYDLVKVSGFDLSQKSRSPTQRAEPPQIPTRSSNEYKQVSKRHQVIQDAQLPSEQPAAGTNRNWHSTVAHDKDSIFSGDGSDDDDDRSLHLRGCKNSQAPPPQYDDENASSVSNSLVSDTDMGSAPARPLPKRDQKYNAAAAVFSAVKSLQSRIENDDKTDEQREMEAIQCLLFSRSDGHHNRRSFGQ